MRVCFKLAIEIELKLFWVFYIYVFPIQLLIHLTPSIEKMMKIIMNWQNRLQLVITAGWVVIVL